MIEKVNKRNKLPFNCNKFGMLGGVSNKTSSQHPHINNNIVSSWKTKDFTAISESRATDNYLLPGLIPNIFQSKDERTTYTYPCIQ